MGKTRDLFNKIKEITGKFTAKVGILRNEYGRTISEATEVKQR